MKKKFSRFCLIILLILSFNIHALEGDTKEPITLESNSGFFDDKKGISIYQGNVIIVQGSFRMNADEVSVYMNDKREIDQMIATGNVVRIKQTPKLEGDDLNGEASKISYYPAKKTLILEGNAVLWQGGNKTVSEYIEYNRASEVMKAGGRNMVNKRVHVILQPSSESK